MEHHISRSLSRMSWNDAVRVRLEECKRDANLPHDACVVVARPFLHATPGPFHFLRRVLSLCSSHTAPCPSAPRHAKRHPTMPLPGRESMFFTMFSVAFPRRSEFLDFASPIQDECVFPLQRDRCCAFPSLRWTTEIVNSLTMTRMSFSGQLEMSWMRIEGHPYLMVAEVCHFGLPPAPRFRRLPSNTFTRKELCSNECFLGDEGVEAMTDAVMATRAWGAHGVSNHGGNTSSEPLTC